MQVLEASRGATGEAAATAARAAGTRIAANFILAEGTLEAVVVEFE